MKALRILGIDVTSAPHKRKPLTGAWARLDGDLLMVDTIQTWTAWPELDRVATDETSTWIGFDAPFGLPVAFQDTMGWPREGGAVLARASALTRSELGEAYLAFRRRWTDRLPLRITDDLARSASPLRWAYVPVGRMFHAASPTLSRNLDRVYPFFSRPPRNRGWMVEVYPKCAARVLTGSSYKSGRRDKTGIRRAMTEAIRRGALREAYGLDVATADAVAEPAVLDREGDVLDAVLAAVQTAWAYRNRAQLLSLRDDDSRIRREGWICDPGTTPGGGCFMER